MRTQCPECSTVFRLTLAELNAANGRVRCGVCYTVFEAMGPGKAQTSSGSGGDPLVPTLIESVQENRSGTGAAGLRRQESGSVPKMPELIPDLAPEPKSGSGGGSRDQRGTIPHGSPLPDLLHQELESEPIVLQRRPPSLLFGLGIVVLVLLLGGQYAYSHRATLAREPALAGILHQACAILGCRLDPRRDLDAIAVVRRTIYSHVGVPGALVISAGLVNQAGYEQPYPDLQVALTDLQGRILAARRFRPAEYLADPKVAGPYMKPDQEVGVRLEIRDPGTQVMAFELALL